MNSPYLVGKIQRIPRASAKVNDATREYIASQIDLWNLFSLFYRIQEVELSDNS